MIVSPESTQQSDEESTSSRGTKRKFSRTRRDRSIRSIELIRFCNETAENIRVKTLESTETPCVTSELSCSFKNNVKCTFGITHTGRRTFETYYYDDALKFKSTCSIEKLAERGNALWIPDMHENLPEYLLAASDNLYLYENIDSILIPRGYFRNVRRNNPIISCGWCSQDPQYVCSVQLNGACSIFSLGRKDKVITFNIQNFHNPNWNIVDTNVGMCFFQGSSNHSFVTYNDKTVNFLNDIRCPENSYVHNFENPIFSVKSSLRSPWLVACAERKTISIMDVRFSNRVCFSMGSTDPSHNATCFSWSLHGDIAIGTEQGKFIFWSPEKNEIQKVYDSNSGYIYSLEYHRSATDILFVCH
ncbi:uncharacterized protein LOC111635329 isoform X1 [Centruroides sculpturatus]|uniref:uncharacterized protein LOC111635329 isoform X1 n=1 Tax=Centruroides sculpturatus TaxID=218467 RepID=UPI000C6E6236|nr:uncharacterized protein LOC111635329 isoform X1 [Centruroides sculpturatus]